MKRSLGIAIAIGVGVLALWVGLGRTKSGAGNTDQVNRLLREAQNAGHEKRLAAIQELGRMRSEAAVDDLVGLLPDTRPEIRMALLVALGQIASPKAAGPLEVLLRVDEWQVRKATVEVLGEIRSPTSIPALGRALQDSHASVSTAAATALSRMGEPGLEALGAALKAPAAVHVSQAVAYGLGRIAAPGAIPLLRGMLADPVAVVRLAGAEALCQKPGGADVVQALRPLLSDPDPEVRQGVAKALPALGDAAIPLFVQLATDKKMSLRRDAVKFLSASGDPRGLPVLFAAQGDPEKSIRDMADTVLSRLPRDQRVALAAENLRQPQASLRMKALEWLDEIKEPRSADALTSILADESSDVRLKAAEILLSMGDARGTEAMVRGLTDPNPDVRYQAAEQLAQAGNAKGADVLLAVVRDTPRTESDDSTKTRERGSPELKRVAQAMRLLGKLGDKRVAEHAMACIKVTALSGAACETLGQLKDPRAYDLLAARLPGEKIANLPIVNALGALGDRRAIPLLLGQMLRMDVQNGQDKAATTNAATKGFFYRLAHNWLRKSIIEAIASIGGDESVAALIRIMEITPSQNIQLLEFLCEVMSNLGDPQFIKPISNLLVHDCPEPPEAAMRALKKMQAKAIPILIMELKEPGAARHSAIAMGLAELGAAAADPLLEALKDPDPATRHGAAWALGQMREPRALAPLLGMLADANDDARAGAAWALGQLRDPQAIEPLIQLGSQTQAVSRAAAAEALGLLGDARAGTTLEKLTQDADPRVARAARTGLQALSGAGRTQKNSAE